MNIHDVLHRSTSSGEVLCIYCDNANTNTFSAGIIQDSDEAFVLINHLTPDGDYDGYMLRRIDDIYLIESNNKYALSLCKMYAQKEKKHMMIGKDPGSIMERLLKYAKEGGLIVSIELCASGYCDVQGFLTCIDNDHIAVRIIDDTGKEDGEAYIECDAVTKIICDSEDETSLEELYKEANSN